MFVDSNRPTAVPQGPKDAQLRDAAVALEASFLSEMLKHSGLDGLSGSFGGSTGETQFASLLRDEQAHQMAKAGGIGLAEKLFHALRERQDG